MDMQGRLRAMAAHLDKGTAKLLTDAADQFDGMDKMLMRSAEVGTGLARTVLHLAKVIRGEVAMPAADVAKLEREVIAMLTPPAPESAPLILTRNGRG